MDIRKPFIQPLEAVRSERGNWFSFMGQLHKASTFWQLMLSNLLVASYTWGLVYWYEDYLDEPFKISTSMHSILGVTLGLLLVVRTNTAYDRWWEGRKLLGALVNNSRNLALKVNALLPAHAQDVRKQFADLISAYCIAMKEHLREGVKFDELSHLDEGLLAKLKGVSHVPNRIASELYALWQACRKNHPLEPIDTVLMDKQLEALTDIVGACERIKKTPLPFAYRMHLKIFILIYVSTLPFGIMHEMHYWTIPVVCLIFYAMVGIELIGEEIEDPFGNDESDIPMDTIMHTIQHDVYEVLDPEAIAAR